MNTGFKQTEIGIFPEDWDIITLDDACRNGGLVRGPFGGALKKEYFVERGYKVYEQRNAIYSTTELGSYFIDSRKFREMSRFEVNPGDFIVSCSGTIGRIFRIPERAPKGIINQALLKIEIDPDVVDSEFFLSVFQSNKFQERIIDNTHGGAMKNLVGMDIFRNTLIQLPPLKEQRLIANALSDVDELIAALDKLIAKKRAVKTAVMQQLLTGKTRLPGFGKRKGKKRTSIGLIPEDWEVEEFGSLADNIMDYRGRTPKKIGMEWGGGEIPALSAGNVKMGYIDFSQENYYGSEELYQKWMTNGDPKKGDILFTMEAPLGNVALVPDNKKYILSQRTILVQVNSRKANNEFLFHQLTWESFQKILLKNATGSTAKGIRRTRLVKLPVLVPPLSEQQAIAEALSDIDAEIAAIEKRRDKTKAIKQGMMQELLTGRTRLL